MDFYGNDKRKDRCDDLVASMEASMLAMNNSQNALEAKTDFYKEIVLKAARARGYPTIDAMEADMVALMDEVDKSDMAQYKASQDGLTKMHAAIGSLSFVSIAAGAFGSVAMKRQFGKNILPWNRYNKANHVKVLKNALSFRLTVIGPRELKVKRALGKISQTVFDSKMREFALAANMMKMQDAAEFAKGGKFADATVVLEAARMLKRMKKITQFFEIAGWVAEIGAIVTEAIVGKVMQDKLREAIDGLVPQRFVMKKLELMGRVYDTFNERVAIAVGVWVQNQAAAVSGGGCYVEDDKALEEALAQANVDLMQAMVGVCDCAVLEACRADDLIQNSWTNEDPSYREILEYLGEPNPTDVPECEIHHPTGAGNTQPTPQEPAEIYPTLRQGSDVTASNCRYVELNEGKGALWRIRGGFWTFQQPLSTNTTGEPAGLKGSRVQFQERRRTSNKIYLQNIGNWPWNENAGNWIAPAADQLYPYVVLNFSNGKLETLPGSANLDNPVAATPWGSRTMDPSSYSNLAQVNGWTLYFVPALTVEGAEVHLRDAHECNPTRGWEYRFKIAEDPWIQSNLMEVSRSKDKIQVFSRSMMVKEKWPKGWVDVTAKKVVYQEEKDGDEVSFDIDVDKEVMWKARLNYT